MVYIKLPCFKTGVTPNKVRDMHLKVKVSLCPLNPLFLQYANPKYKDHWEAKYYKLSPKDKLSLARNRIWGNKIGGMGFKNGYSHISRHWKIYEMNNYYKHTQYNLLFPEVVDHETQNEMMEKYEYRRLRADIREMKLGNKPMNDEGSSMSVFELKAKNKLGVK